MRTSVPGQGYEAGHNSECRTMCIIPLPEGAGKLVHLFVRDILATLESQYLYPSSRRCPMSALVALSVAACPDSQRAQRKYLFCLSGLTN